MAQCKVRDLRYNFEAVRAEPMRRQMRALERIHALSECRRERSMAMQRVRELETEMATMRRVFLARLACH